MLDACGRVHVGTQQIDAVAPRGQTLDLGSTIAAHCEALPVQGGDLGLHTNLEPVEAGSQHLAETFVGIQHERVVSRPPHPQQHVDLAGGLQHEAPRRLADLQRPQVLRQLRLEIGQRVGPRHLHDVTRILGPEALREGHGNSVAAPHPADTLWPWKPMSSSDASAMACS